TAHEVEVDGQSAVEGDGLQRVGGHRAGEVTAVEVVLLALGFAFVDEVGAAGDVDDALGQGFVERDGGEAVPADAGLVAEGLTQGLPEHDRGVLYGMVDVDVGVTGGGDVEVDHRVLRQCGEHMVEERHARGDGRSAGAVESDGHGHRGL